MLGRLNTYILILLIIFMASCASWHLVQVNPYLNVNNEIMIRPELKELLREKKENIKIVLRVPALALQVSQTEREQRNKLYDIVEKELYKAGFIVRDRALLEKVLESGPTSYQDMAQKIDTDLILEIISLDTNVNLSHRTYYDPSLNRTEQLVEKYNNGSPGPLFAIFGGKLECRIITVKDGAVTGVLTFFCAPLRPKFEVMAPYMNPRNPEPNPQKYIGYKFGDTEETARTLVLMLIQTLLNHKMVAIEIGTQAGKYGLQTGDIILAINGQGVFNSSQAVELIENSKNGIELKVKRGGEILTITVPNRQALASATFEFRPVE